MLAGGVMYTLLFRVLRSSAALMVYAAMSSSLVKTTATKHEIEEKIENSKR